MATRDAIIQRRVVAVERIKAALPGVQFKRLQQQAGTEAQHVTDLETIADALEANGGNETKGKSDE